MFFDELAREARAVQRNRRFTLEDDYSEESDGKLSARGEVVESGAGYDPLYQDVKFKNEGKKEPK